MGVAMKTKKKGTNTKTSFNKQRARDRFLNRHIDQVKWEPSSSIQIHCFSLL